MPNRFSFPALFAILSLGFWCPYSGSSAAAGETRETDKGWVVVRHPATVNAGDEIKLEVELKPEAVKEASKLKVDMHAFIGPKRKAGQGAWGPSPFKAGESVKRTMTFKVPTLPGISAVAFPIYISPTGGWGEKTMVTEVQLRLGHLPAPKPVESVTIKAPPRPIEQPPVEIQSAKRAEMVLNGPWNFRPAAPEIKFENIDPDEWGQIWVPGSWGKPTGTIPGIIRTRDAEIWKKCSPEMLSAWYERNVKIPADWDGRAIVLDLARISTEAVVYANGQECGKVQWPSGTVEITHAVKAGQDATIRVRVFAVESGEMEKVWMGTLDADSMRKAKLEGRGLIGDVILASRPRGAHVSDILVKPSVRQKQLGCRVEVRDFQGGEVTFTARLLDEYGKEENSFTATRRLGESPLQNVELAWDWANPRLWDIGQPNLYRLVLEARGAGLDDAYAQEFGFREFWIDGKEFYLNNRKIRLRPWATPLGNWIGGGMQEMTDDAVSTFRGHGLNMLYIWPSDPQKRGAIAYSLYEQWFKSADRQGMLMTAPAPWFDVRGKSRDEIDWTPEKREAYQQTVDTHLRRYRNHPSIVLWGGTANQFPLQKAHNPKLIGRSKGLPDDLRDYTGKNRYTQLVKAGGDAIAAFKEIDPTRPYYCHHDSFVGDINCYNMYLNQHPLQEREDWMSYYAEHGDVPFASHEFGTPVDVTFTRGRSGNHGRSLGAEPLHTEFCAVYQGADSYKNESQEFRASIAKFFNPAKANAEAPWPKWGPQHFMARDSQNHLNMQALFIRNTWRSWRTWGITGGLYPWWGGNFKADPYAGNEGFRRQNAGQMVDMPPFKPGRRGPYLEKMPLGCRYVMNTEPDKGGFNVTVAGKALLENNGSTLIWIAGPQGEHTAKDHTFFAGETVKKQIIIVNDEITPVPAYKVTWTAEIDGKGVGGGELEGQVESGTVVRLPIAFDAPANAPKTEGVIRLQGTVGPHTHTDEFSFRVYTKPSAGKVKTVAIVDGKDGITSKWLKTLGYNSTPWTGAQVPLLVIGRNALSDGVEIQGDLNAYVQNGGRVIIFNQNHTWIQKTLGLRTSAFVTRRAWPVMSDHPLTKGLDGEDFRDWRGAGTAFPEEINTEVAPNKPHPNHGWHWGNRGSVASAAWEKPHFSGWTPILECEFDLAYSPLMETEIGQGKVIWCSLDLEGRTQAEPVAAIMTQRLLEYGAASSLQKTVSVGYLGDNDGRSFLERLGVKTSPANPGTSGMIVAGPGCSDADLAPYTDQGTPILVLAREGNAPFGVKLKKANKFVGSLNVPDWPECGGLSASDLRLRSETDWWVLDNGCEIGSDGLIGRKTVGKSTVIYCQLDPEDLQADKLVYFRYTRWRQHRAISNLLANLGAAFIADENLLGSISGSRYVSLAEGWKVKQTLTLDAAEKPDQGHADPGLSDAAKDAVKPEADDAGWESFKPGFYPGFENQDGEAVFRITFSLPEEMAGKDLELSLGSLDDFDDTFWNGQRIGRTDKNRKEYWVAKRRYKVPGRLVKAGKTVIAVRVFDRYGGGGFSRVDDLSVKVGQSHRLYHPDWNWDFVSGDDPFRWNMW